jgi:hypothetical protein
MQPAELRTWRTLEQAVAGHLSLEQALTAWSRENGSGPAEPDPRDPTAEVSVDRVMRRLGYHPTNPESQVYDAFPDAHLEVSVFGVRADEARGRRRHLPPG